MKLKPARHKQCLLLFMVTVSGLTAQANLVRTPEKVIYSLQSSNCAKDLAKPPSSIASVCDSDKERLYSYLYKLHYNTGM
jgi:hypothetical protein